jgi:cytochrome c-type biogenesis protein CcmE
MRRPTILLTVALLAAVAVAAPTAVKIPELLAKPDTYNAKEVKTAGKVEAFQQKTSKAGNDYFVFKLAEKDKKVNVYGRGKLENAPKNGQNAEITGIFRKEKKFGDQVFKNEIEVTTKGVKVLKE